MKPLSHLFALFVAILLVCGCSKSDKPADDVVPLTEGTDSAAPADASVAMPLASATPAPAKPRPTPVPDEGFLKTASGLKIKIVEEGTGAPPARGETVSVHYTGRLLDGTVFDSSRQRSAPLEFPLGRGVVIRGWDEGIALLKKGGKAQLVVPPELGYGEGGVPPLIPPKATLIFDVELVDTGRTSP